MKERIVMKDQRMEQDMQNQEQDNDQKKKVLILFSHYFLLVQQSVGWQLISIE